MAGVAEDDRDRVAVEVVEPDHADGGVDRVIGHLAEHVAAVPGLAPVDADRALAPAAAEPGGLQPRVGFTRRLDEARDQGLPEPLLEGELLGRVRHVVREGDAAVRVARVEEDVGDRDAERLGDANPQLLSGPLRAQREVDADDREVDAGDDDLRGAVGEDERGRGEIALDRLDRVAEEPKARLTRSERRVDGPPRSAGAECPSGRGCRLRRLGSGHRASIPLSDQGVNRSVCDAKYARIMGLQSIP